MKKQEKRKQPRVIVFTTPTCSFCRAVKQYLRKKGIRFKEVDLTRDPAAARDVVRRTRQQGVPVVYIGSKYVIGFDQPKIDKLLGIK